MSAALHHLDTPTPAQPSALFSLRPARARDSMAFSSTPAPSFLRRKGPAPASRLRNVVSPAASSRPSSRGFDEDSLLLDGSVSSSPSRSGGSPEPSLSSSPGSATSRSISPSPSMSSSASSEDLQAKAHNLKVHFESLGANDKVKRDPVTSRQPSRPVLGDIGNIPSATPNENKPPNRKQSDVDKSTRVQLSRGNSGAHHTQKNRSSQNRKPPTSNSPENVRLSKLYDGSEWALPDISGLTAGLLSPEKPHSHMAMPNMSVHSPNIPGKKDLQDGLHGLRKQLDTLEKNHASSAERIRELDNALQEQRQNDLHRRQDDDFDSKKQRTEMRNDMEAERLHRQALEVLVQRLNGHVDRLSKSLSALKETRGWENEVQLLHDGLRNLGEEVHDVRSLVEHLSREKQKSQRDDVKTLIEKMGTQRATSEGAEGEDKEIRALGEEVREIKALVERLTRENRGEVGKDEIKTLMEKLENQKKRTLDEDEKRANGFRSEIGEMRSLVERLVREKQKGSSERNQRSTDFDIPEYLQRHAFERQPEANVDAEKKKSASTQVNHLNCAACGHLHGSDGQDEDREPRREQKYPSRDSDTRRRYNSEHKQPREDDLLRRGEDILSRFGHSPTIEIDNLPPQTRLTRRLRDLETDFAQHKKLFIELSDAYRNMDPAVLPQKRRILAQHLRESVDSLEEKADEIRRLYDLLHCHDSALAWGS